MPNANTELGSKPLAIPNPKRVAAGKLNYAKRKGLTPEGRERLRRVAEINQPWRFSTGPRTREGKAVAAANGKARQLGLLSTRELKADMRKLKSLLKDLKASRDLLGV